MTQEHSLARRRRQLLVYSVNFVLGTSLLVFLFWSLRSLLMPIIMGSLLAYLFRPLIYSFKSKYIPDSLRVILMLGLLVYALVMGVKKIQSNLPSELERLELQIRVQYKFTEKYKKLMGLDEATGKGNFIYNFLHADIEPIVSKIQHILWLSSEQESQYLKLQQNAEDPLSQKYFQYYLKNREKFGFYDEVKPQDLKKEKTSAKTKTPNPLAPPTTPETTTSLATPNKEDDTSKAGFIAKFFSVFSTWLLMPFVFIFLLFDKGEIKHALIRLVPNRYFEMSLTIVNEVDEAIGNYLRGTLLECSLVGLTFALGLYFIGIEIKLSIIIGLIAGLTNAIPFLGPAIGLVVGLSYALIAEEIQPLLPFITTDNLIVAVLVVVGVTQLLDNVLYQPVVLGSAVNLHPLVVIIGVMGGSILLGFSGMLLAIPTIVIFKVIVETAFKELRAYKII